MYTNKVLFKSFVEAHSVCPSDNLSAYLTTFSMTNPFSLSWEPYDHDKADYYACAHTHTHTALLNVWVPGCLRHNSPLSDNTKRTCAVDKEHSVRPGTSSSLFNYICVSLFLLWDSQFVCAFLSVPINSYSRSLLPP